MGRVGEGKNSNFLKFHSKFTENRPRTTPGKHKYSSDPPPPREKIMDPHMILYHFIINTVPQKKGENGGGQFESFKIRFLRQLKRRVPKKKACIICLNVT